MKDRCGLGEDGGILFIDEAQECPVLARYIKSFKEDYEPYLFGSFLRTVGGS